MALGSSLSYLQRFPVDILKIDRAFVNTIGAPAESSPAPAIVSLARTLHLQAIGEGVETAIEVDALSALGCELAQGFYFSGPIDVPATDALLAHTTIQPAPQALEPRYDGG